MMCVAALAVATVTWALVGYSLAFDGDGNGSSAASTTRSSTTSTFDAARRDHDPAPRLLGLPGDVLHHHHRAGVRRGRRAHALRPVPASSPRCGRCSSTRCSPTGRSAAAGCRRTARSTSPAASRSRWARASRRWPPRSWSARARTTAARRCCPTTRSTCCSAPACCGSAGSASTAAAGSRPGTRRARLHQHAARPRACTLVVWFVLDLIRGRQVTAIGAATAIIVGCVGDHAGGRLHQPGLGDGARRARRAAELRGHRVAPAHAGGRDARRARRPRHRGPHGHPVHRLLRPESWNGVGGRPALRRRRRSSAGRRSPRWPRPSTRSA